MGRYPEEDSHGEQYANPIQFANPKGAHRPEWACLPEIPPQTIDQAVRRLSQIV